MSGWVRCVSDLGGRGSKGIPKGLKLLEGQRVRRHSNEDEAEA